MNSTKGILATTLGFIAANVGRTIFDVQRMIAAEAKRLRKHPSRENNYYVPPSEQPSRDRDAGV